MRYSLLYDSVLKALGSSWFFKLERLSFEKPFSLSLHIFDNTSWFLSFKRSLKNVLLENNRLVALKSKRILEILSIVWIKIYSVLIIKKKK